LFTLSALDRSGPRMSANTARLLKIAAVLVLLIAAIALLPVKQWLGAALEWTAANPSIAWLTYIALYIVATVALIPGLILTIGAGAIFGLPRGLALASAGSVLGATAAFFVGRTLARDWIGKQIAAWPKFRALDQAIGARGFLIVLLTRLSPAFPFNLLNYAYGVTRVKARDYLIGSWLGMLPATALYVYAGSALANVAQALTGKVSTGSAGRVLLLVGLAATIAVTVFVTRLARRYLDAELAQ
jgi:uncharacterized membrane protein YdjX (TVP38/TMEM64 family)